MFHGCGSDANNVPIQNASGADAIIVRGQGDDGTCWTNTSDPNVPFFDAMRQATLTRTCVDEKKLFAVGYSSGSWLVTRLSCERADVLRAAGTVAGGLPAGVSATCPGQTARVFVHDQEDMDNQYAWGLNARDHILQVNQCDLGSEPTPVDPEPCVRYAGCAEPVIWCGTSGRGHDRQDDFAPELMWDFFSSL